MKKINCIILTVLFVFSSVISVFAHGEAAETKSMDADISGTTTDLALELRVPLVSPLFIETPVASVNSELIMLGEFVHDFVPGETDTVYTQRLESRLDSLIKNLLDKQGGSTKQVETYVEPTSLSNGTIALNVPLFSEYFSDTPVAVVNGESINFGGFAQQIISGMSDGSIVSHDYMGLLKRLITVKLFVLEAKNIGIHESETIEKKISNFADEALARILLQEHSKDVTPVKQEVEEAYRLLSQEVKLKTIKILSQRDADEFMETYSKDGDFGGLADIWVAKGRATISAEDEYVHVDELLPKIKSDISQMEKDSVSQIYKAAGEGYLIFKLLDRRFVEDQDVYQDIYRRNLEKERQLKSFAYIETLEDKYVRYNLEAQEALDFEALKEKDPDLDLRDYLQQLLDDQRTLATFEGDSEQKITIAEIAEKVNASFYHGMEATVTAAKLNEEKEKALYNLQFKITSRLEAEKLGLNKDRRYLDDVEKFTTTTLFESFLETAIAPEVAITEEEVRQSYNERMNEFSSPAMLKMKSLVFESEKEAKVAFDRLKSGSDFKWVSANSTGLVDKDAEGVMPFESNLLSATALPEGIQDKASKSVSGDVLLYTDPGKYEYVLFVEAAYAPQPKAYESVRSEVGQALYNRKIQQIIDHWASRLKEAYKTEIFLIEK